MAVHSIRVFLVGSDREAVNRYIETLAQIEDVDVVGEAENADSAMRMIRELLPNVVLVDDEIPDDPYRLAEEIGQQFVNMAAILVSGSAAEDSYRKALQAGARDVLVRPVEPVALVDAVYRAYDFVKKRKTLVPVKPPEETRARPTKVISVFSTKGGVGKTTVAVNLAVTLARKTKGRVVLWDLDLYHGMVAVATNVVQRRHITDLLNEIQYLDEDLLESYLEQHESGVMILAAPFTPEFADFVSADHVNKILDLLREKWDYVVIDMPSFFHEPTVAAMSQSDLILLVASLDLGTIKNLKACLMMMDNLHFSRAKLKLLLNRAGREFGVLPQDLESTLKMPIFVSIPADARNVLTGLNQGVPTAYAAPGSEFGRAFQLMAEAITGGKDLRQPQKKKWGFLSRWFKTSEAGGS